MDELVKAIQAKDLTKTQRLFDEAMKPLVAKIIEEQKVIIAKSVMSEGEKPDTDEDDEDDDENEE